MVAALVLGLINALIRPILILLTLPATILTLGLFIFVINGLLFWVVGSFVPRLHASTASGPPCFGADRLQPDLVGAVGAAARTQVMARRRCPRAALYSLEFFPPRTPEGTEKLRGRAPPARAAQAGVLLGDVRRRRLDARRHAGDGARDPRRGPRRRAAHLVHRLAPRESIRDVLDAVPRARHPPSRRAARRPAVGHGRRGRVPLCERARRVHPRGDRRLVPHRRRRVSGISSAGAQPAATTSTTSSARSTPARTRRSRSTSSTRDAYWSFVDACADARPRRPDRAGHHADRELLEARALLRRVRRRDPALDPPPARRLRRRHARRSARSASTS